MDAAFVINAKHLRRFVCYGILVCITSTIFSAQETPSPQLAVPLLQQQPPIANPLTQKVETLSTPQTNPPQETEKKIVPSTALTSAGSSTSAEKAIVPLQNSSSSAKEKESANTSNSGSAALFAAMPPVAQQPAQLSNTAPASSTTMPVNSSTQAPSAQTPSAQTIPQLPQTTLTAPNISEKLKTAAPATQSTLQSQASSDELFDTTLDEGGNWLLKRKALEKTIDLLEKINNLFTQLLDLRMDFFVKRNKADKDFNAFVQTIAFDLGDLDNLLETLITEGEAELKSDGEYTPEEQQIIQSAQERKKELVLLQQQIRDVSEIDILLDDVLTRVEEQINVGNNYKQQAWKNFQEIKKTLSDEKAEALYIQTESLFKNIQEIHTSYLKGELGSYFNSTLKDLTDGTAKAKQAIEALKAKGIDLKKEIQRLEKAQQDKLKAAEEAKDSKEKAELDEAEKKLKELEAEKSASLQSKKSTEWYSSIANVFISIGNAVKKFFGSIISIILRGLNFITSFFGRFIGKK